MATKNPHLYGTYIALNTLAFVISLVIMAALFIQPIYRKVGEHYIVQYYLVWVSICLLFALGPGSFQYLNGPVLISVFVTALTLILVCFVASLFIGIMYGKWKLRKKSDTKKLGRNSV